MFSNGYEGDLARAAYEILVQECRTPSMFDEEQYLFGDLASTCEILGKEETGVYGIFYSACPIARTFPSVKICVFRPHVMFLPAWLVRPFIT